MISTAVERIIKEAVKNKVLPLKDLDALLDDEALFDENLEKINTCLDDSILFEIPEDERKCSDRPRHLKMLASRPGDEAIYLDYVSCLRKIPPTTREEEYQFAKRMEFFKRRMIQVIKALKLPPETADFFLAKTSCKGLPETGGICPTCDRLGHCARGKEGPVFHNCRAYNKCRGEFVERSLHLVVNLIQPYRTYGIPVMDLVQEGNTALIRAVEKFDWRKAVRLKTYADFWVRQSVERAINNNKGIIRVPTHVQQKIRRSRREGKLPAERSGITAREFGEVCGVSDLVASHLLITERNHVSLNERVSKGRQSTSLADLLFQEPEEFMPKEEAMALRKNLQEAMEDLTEQERVTLHHRFGMDGVEVKTLAELGKMMNVSQERVRHVQRRALEKLSKPKLRERLAAFL